MKAILACAALLGASPIVQALADDAGKSVDTVVVSEPGKPVAVGKVVDPAAEPQAGVPVKVEGPDWNTYAFTDEKGEWTLYNLPAGEYSVRLVNGLGEPEKSVKFKVLDSAWTQAGRGTATYNAPALELKNWVAN